MASGAEGEKPHPIVDVAVEAGASNDKGGPMPAERHGIITFAPVSNTSTEEGASTSFIMTTEEGEEPVRRDLYQQPFQRASSASKALEQICRSMNAHSSSSSSSLPPSSSRRRRFHIDEDKEKDAAYLQQRIHDLDVELLRLSLKSSSIPLAVATNKADDHNEEEEQRRKQGELEIEINRLKGKLTAANERREDAQRDPHGRFASPYRTPQEEHVRQRAMSFETSRHLLERWENEEEEPHDWRVNGWLRERLRTAMELA